MEPVNVHDAKTRLSSLLAQVERGQEIVIARNGRPIARLVPYEAPRQARVLGRDHGLFEVPEDFDDPLPPDVLEGFLG